MRRVSRRKVWALPREASRAGKERKGAGRPRGRATAARSPVATANREESAEAIVAATPAAKGRTQTEGVTEEDHACGRRQTTSN